MLRQCWLSFTRPIKAVLLFDVNRILFWDVSGTPIPTVVWKALAGYVAAVVLLEMMR